MLSTAAPRNLRCGMREGACRSGARYEQCFGLEPYSRSPRTAKSNRGQLPRSSPTRRRSDDPNFFTAGSAGLTPKPAHTAAALNLNLDLQERMFSAESLLR